MTVLERLERIRELERGGAAPGPLLDELRALLREAEVWAQTEGGEAGKVAVERLRGALARDMIEV